MTCSSVLAVILAHSAEIVNELNIARAEHRQTSIVFASIVWW